MVTSVWMISLIQSFLMPMEKLSLRISYHLLLLRNLACAKVFLSPAFYLKNKKISFGLNFQLFLSSFYLVTGWGTYSLNFLKNFDPTESESIHMTLAVGDHVSFP